MMESISELQKKVTINTHRQSSLCMHSELVSDVFQPVILLLMMQERSLQEENKALQKEVIKLPNTACIITYRCVRC
jgi:hypothetical protein